MTLIYFSVAWSAGILWAELTQWPWWVWALMWGVGLGMTVAKYHRDWVRLAGVCLIALGLGGIRLLWAQPTLDEDALAAYNDQGLPVVLEGVIVAEPDERETYTNLRLQVDHLGLPDGAERVVKGRALVKADRYPRFRYGDRVSVIGWLETPPEFDGFSYKDYLARQGIHSLVQHAEVERLAQGQGRPSMALLLSFKRYAQGTIAAILPEPQAALLTGILLGDETGIPDRLMDVFAATGTTHIIAISGFNITIVAALFDDLSCRLVGKRHSAVVAIAGVIIYTILVGASAAVVRAALMGIAFLIGRRVGRPAFAPASLAVAGLVMTVLNPYVLWDVGFQLSFAATAGLILYVDPLEDWAESLLRRRLSTGRARRIVALLSEGVLVTMAAQVATLPVILYHFGRLSLITLLTNFLILPVQSYVMIVGGLATLLGLVVRPLGQVAGWGAWLLLTYTIEAVRLTGHIPYASVPLQMSGWMMWTYYGLVGTVTWWASKPQEARQQLWEKLLERLDVKLIYGSIVAVGGLALAVFFSLPDGLLHVAVLDVGQGDAIFVQTPSGQQVLIDGGPSETALLPQLGRQMPFWDRSLDLVMLTHPDDDHVTGLVSVLERYRVKQVVHRPLELDSAVYELWRRLLAEEGARIHHGEEGLQLTLGEEVGLVVLHPGAELEEGTNDNSVVIRVTYGQMSLLLTGDVTTNVEEKLMAGQHVQSMLLKVAHHGSCGSTSQTFLDAVAPQLAVISVGAENRFDHPCADVVERLEGIPTYRTDEHGTVEIISDGTTFKIETER